jgi:hypothetical protein
MTIKVAAVVNPFFPNAPRRRAFAGIRAFAASAPSPPRRLYEATPLQNAFEAPSSRA